jgi:RimJ/RimL family protein N-acetyltransferase
MLTIMADPGNLETERLFIRRFALSDAPFIIELLNQKSFIQNIRDIGVRTITDAENYLKNGSFKSYEQFGFGLSLVTLKDGTPVGMCGLIKRDTLTDVDIGFAFLSDHEGKGYASESARSVLEEGRLIHKLKRVVAITNPENTGSINVLMKAGFQFEKMIRLSPEAMELKLFSILL